LGFTDGALLDDAIDAIAARDGATLFKTVDRVIESGHDPRRFTSDLLERLRDLMIVDALAETNANSILRDLPDDQLERMRNQSQHIGSANLSRAADIAAEGLTQMRGATAPRLILELICGRILLPGGDTSESGLLSRIERLERAENLAPMSNAQPSVKQSPTPNVGDFKEVLPKSPSKAEEIAPKKVVAEVATPKEKVVAEEVKKTPVKASTGMDIAGLRRVWPDVIEDVKKRRRLTWSLLSASAQVLGLDDSAITIGIVNAGARDSFIRSESDVILRQAFVDVVGIDRKIEVVVDASINPNTPQARETRVDESPSDVEQLSGHALLAKELGAQIITEGK
jgi:DNA polymerase-3 subunit gamma/tau